MKFGYTIIYVSDVFASVTFFEQAFGLNADSFMSQATQSWIQAKQHWPLLAMN